jgi:GT2 family glycosyltransferase
VPRLITLYACHNRRELTLAALADLHAQRDLDQCVIDHVLVDDASNDGTAAAVCQAFPAVTIVPGTGQLYWAGGMRLGWEQAVRQRTFDYLFVYNDDIRLQPEALATLLATATAWPKRDQPLAIVATLLNPATGQPSYGGRCRCRHWHPLRFGPLLQPNGLLQTADVCGMNAVLISRSALDAIGFLDPVFHHTKADIDFALRLNRAGGAVVVAPQALGTCHPNPPLQLRGLRHCWFVLVHPKGDPPRQRWVFNRRYGGPLWPLLFLSKYLTIWLPSMGLPWQR